MSDCACGQDCRAMLRAAILGLASSRMLTNGRLEQVCRCGNREPAGGLCSACGHRPQPVDWWAGSRTLAEAVSGVLPGSTASHGHSEGVA